MDKTINQYINQLHLDPKREAAVRKLVESVSSNSGSSSNGTADNNEMEFVDLGLPSGTLWASCNLGANNPEELGDLYMWGDLTPWKAVEDENGKYYCINEDNVRYDNKSKYKYYKYINENTYNYTKYIGLKNEGITPDFKTTLDLIDDAAYNYNKEYRTPSIADVIELINYTTFEIVKNTYYGSIIKLTSKLNNNYIYLHSTNGIFMSTNSLLDYGYAGTRCSTICTLNINNDSLQVDAGFSYGCWFRENLYSIRPIKKLNGFNDNMINIYTLHYTSDDIVIYSQFLTAYNTNKLVYDIYTKRLYSTITLYEDKAITALTIDWDDNEGKNSIKVITITPDGQITK